MQTSFQNHYAVLGLDRLCTEAQIRAAYRVLAKQHHPDINANSSAAVKRTQELNAAYEVLSDPARRDNHDRELATPKRNQARSRNPKTSINFLQDVNLRLEDFLRGTTLEVRVRDASQGNEPEIYPLTIPPDTAPGMRFKVPRSSVTGGGFILVRVKALPDFRFKVRGPDLRMDLRITNQRAAQGGLEMVRGLRGNPLRVQIPRGVARGEILRINGEGLPNSRGGRGDLLVRIMYRPEIQIAKCSGR